MTRIHGTLWCLLLSAAALAARGEASLISAPRLNIQSDFTNLTVSLTGAPGYQHLLETSADSRHWSPLAVITGPAQHRVNVPPMGEARLFRARVVEEVFYGPFSNWLDVRRDFGARGDGVADDTAALQAALDNVRTNAGRPVVYLPAGTYRLTGPLVLRRTGHYDAKDVMVLGEHPDRTTLRWDGVTGGTMLGFEAWFARLGRLTFDGAGRAKTAITHGNLFSSANEISDAVFRDLEFGIEAGQMNGAPVAETVVRRCHFVRCSKAGVSLQNFNSLDWFVWDSIFEDCGAGVANHYGAGHFHVYRSRFLRSREADLFIGHTEYFSIRHCWSSGSQAFLRTWTNFSSAQITLQSNNVLAPAGRAIRLGNVGPLMLFDNAIASGTNAAVSSHHADAEVFAAGNRFSAASPVAGLTTLAGFDNHTGATIDASGEAPTAPLTPPAFAGQVIELAPSDSAAMIQAALQHAALLAPEPVLLHLPAGLYNVSQPLRIPAGANLHLVGDGGKTILKYTGTNFGSVLRVPGPARLTVRDLQLHGGYTNQCLEITGCDQPGARIFLDQLDVRHATGTGLLAEGLAAVAVEAEAFYHSFCNLGVKVSGRGTNDPTDRTLNLIGGAAIHNDRSYEVRAGGRLLVQDMWYETHDPLQPGFLDLNDCGSFTLHGANIAPRYSTLYEPTLQLTGFRGKVALIGARLGFPETQLVAENFDGSLSLLLLGVNRYRDPDLHLPAEKLAIRSNFRSLGGGAVEKLQPFGSGDAAFFAELLRETRAHVPRRPTPLRPELADIRLHRVFAERAATVIRIGP